MISAIVSLTFLGLLSGSTFAQDPVKIGLYYESLCPDSKAFITNQVWPTYQLVPEIFTVDFVPFGKANFTQNGTGWDFICQHGPRECEGNKIHSCELRDYPANSISVQFIYCSMYADDPIISAPGCAADQQLDWDKISACAYSDEGSALLKANGDKTYSLDPPLDGMPWIVVNDAYTEETHDYAFNDLLGLVCSLYTGVLPPECSTAAKK